MNKIHTQNVYYPKMYFKNMRKLITISNDSDTNFLNWKFSIQILNRRILNFFHFKAKYVFVVKLNKGNNPIKKSRKFICIPFIFV